MTNRDLKCIVRRIEKLEKAVFSGGNDFKEEQGIVDKKFSGATGGIRFLVTKGFFNAKRSLADIKNELTEKGYHYSLQAVQTGLSQLSKPGGPIVAFKEGGRKRYAKRK